MNQSSSDMAPILIHLMKGVIYEDQHPQLWNELFRLQGKVREYFSFMRLELFLNEAEGFAYLRQIEREIDEEDMVPRLIQRRPLSYRMSLILVLLRKKLLEMEATGSNTRLILTKAEIREMVQVFLPTHTNEANQTDKLYSDINNIVKLGILRELKGDTERLEVRRIIKALVDATWLEYLLKEYTNYASESV